MPPRPLIIDTDPGKDDAVAILLALACPDAFEVRMISAAAGNVGLAHTSGNVRRLCEVAGRPDIAVYAGCPRPIMRPLRTVSEIHGEDGLGGAELPPPVMPLAPHHAVPAIIDAVRAADSPVVLACIAPLTNPALALVMAPDIVERISEIVMMGGSFSGGNITPYASFNLYSDPHAADIVFGCGARVTMIGLDVTRRTMPSPDWCARLRASGSPHARVVADLWEEPTAFMNDACVIIYLLEPHIFEIERMNIAVELVDEVELGRTRQLESGGYSINVATDIDVDGFFNLARERLSNPLWVPRSA